MRKQFIDQLIKSISTEVETDSIELNNKKSNDILDKIIEIINE